MNLLSNILSLVSNRVRHAAARLFRLDLSLEDIGLDERELAEQLYYGRD